MKRARWIYIAGDVRSGSTLLADLLSQSLGAFNAGELGRLWECKEQGQLCTCGAALDECSIWSRVIKRVLDTVDIPSGVDVSDLARGCMSHPQILRRRGIDPPSDDELALRDATERAIEAVTGAEAVVDSTKMARTLRVAGHLDRRLTAVHLVRDPRAVAFACMSNSARDPSLSGRHLGKESVPRSTLGWCIRNLACQRVLRSYPQPEVHHLRYEDLATSPKTELERIVGQPVAQLKAFGSTSEGESHSLGGNPRRFTASEVTLDERWRRQMAPQWKVISTVLSSPWLESYGYRAFDRASRSTRDGRSEP